MKPHPTYLDNEMTQKHYCVYVVIIIDECHISENENKIYYVNSQNCKHYCSVDIKANLLYDVHFIVKRQHYKYYIKSNTWSHE